MVFTLWMAVIGAVFIFMALANTVLKRLPLTTSMLYLALGVALGPLGLSLGWFDPMERSALLERLAEIAVIISLFTAGLKLSLPLSDRNWRAPFRLAFISMPLTVGLVALVGVLGLDMSLGAAVLLGAVLAPTDPVLASEVQVENPGDEDRLRFSLTGEAGLNDGTAFPFVMLGLGLMGLHELGEGAWRWWAVDVAWAITGGLLIGAVLGTLTGYLVLYLRRKYREAVGTDDFLALGLIALAYGVALLAQTYGFLAVFAAGLALRRVERRITASRAEDEEAAAEVRSAAKQGEKEEVATDPKQAPAYMAQAVLGFNEQLERIGQVALVVLVGATLFTGYVPLEALWFAPLFFFVIRPLSVWLGLLGADVLSLQRYFIGWFGIRGIGSIYYLMFAVEHDLPEGLAVRLTQFVLTIVALSIFAHGLTVTPLMKLYKRRMQRREAAPQ